MPLYDCDICNFSTKLIGNYKQHLTTFKHKRNLLESQTNETIIEKVSTNEHKMSTNEHKVSTNEHKVSTNEHKMSTNIGKKQCDEIKEFKCDYCGRILKTKPSLSRHLKKYCKKINSQLSEDNQTLQKKLLDLEKKHENEKKELYEKIDKLISKVGNTFNQNIILNNYGNEDLSHIPDDFKTQLLKIPHMMIPKMIEAVHFSDKKPENKNIVVANKKENRLKVYKGNKWIYQNKHDVISNLMDSKYYSLDNHYEQSMNDLNEQCQTNYIKFRQFMEEGDKEFIDKLKQECEMVLLNNR